MNWLNYSARGDYGNTVWITHDKCKAERETLIDYLHKRLAALAGAQQSALHVILPGELTSVPKVWIQSGASPAISGIRNSIFKQKCSFQTVAGYLLNTVH